MIKYHSLKPTLLFSTCNMSFILIAPILIHIATTRMLQCNHYYNYVFIFLAHVSSCLIQKASNTSIGTPTTDGDPETTYSCVASDNCDYEVHVIGNYESSNGRHGIYIQRQAGDTYVGLTVSGQSSRPLILVFASYEPVRWRVSVPRGVQINRVIVVSSECYCIVYHIVGRLYM